MPFSFLLSLSRNAENRLTGKYSPYKNQYMTYQYDGIRLFYIQSDVFYSLWGFFLFAFIYFTIYRYTFDIEKDIKARFLNLFWYHRCVHGKLAAFIVNQNSVSGLLNSFESLSKGV